MKLWKRCSQCREGLVYHWFPEKICQGWLDWCLSRESRNFGRDSYLKRKQILSHIVHLNKILKEMEWFPTGNAVLLCVADTRQETSHFTMQTWSLWVLGERSSSLTLGGQETCTPENSLPAKQKCPCIKLNIKRLFLTFWSTSLITFHSEQTDSFGWFCWPFLWVTEN